MHDERRSGWTGRGVAVGLLALAAVLAVAATATAASRTDTVTIDPGAYQPVQIPFNDGPAMKVAYDIEVTEGPNIDVMVMDNANFQKYESGDSFQYAAGWSDLDTGNTDLEFTLEEHATWYIVMDHTSEPDDGTQPATVGAESVTARYTVETNVDAETAGRNILQRIPGLQVPALLAAAGGAMVLLRVRGG